ncbi:hypothetical protein KGM_201551 [Danaus plexippus plexippus]|uniref:Uncharacterized protein n=1 Tax=Danaus plexippus plexippus TaxID=278856 RepID=A0A212FJY2_DANPL|nr:hypothetical protein KGM_201551 [Danaus plexippus plexippus]
MTPPLKHWNSLDDKKVSNIKHRAHLRSDSLACVLRGRGYTDKQHDPAAEASMNLNTNTLEPESLSKNRRLKVAR